MNCLRVRLDFVGFFWFFFFFVIVCFLVLLGGGGGGGGGDVGWWCAGCVLVRSELDLVVWGGGVGFCRLM